MGYRDDKYIDEFKKICGLVFFEQAPLELDLREATDLVIKCANLRIACRARDDNYRYNFGDQFTLRAWLESGAKTELEKILEGYGDYLIYAFGVSDPTPRLPYWNVINLESFRFHYKNNKDALKCGGAINEDNSTGFGWFSIPSFPANPPIIFSSSHPSLKLAA
jgi:hypothetical protein